MSELHRMHNVFGRKVAKFYRSEHVVQPHSRVHSSTSAIVEVFAEHLDVRL